MEIPLEESPPFWRDIVDLAGVLASSNEQYSHLEALYGVPSDAGGMSEVGGLADDELFFLFLPAEYLAQ